MVVKYRVSLVSSILEQVITCLSYIAILVGVIFVSRLELSLDGGRQAGQSRCHGDDLSECSVDTASALAGV